MTFDIQVILQSKREFRRGLAVLPIEEKLRLLDTLRERQITLLGASMAVSLPMGADEHRFKSTRIEAPSSE
jgi:hypothetical protein